MPCKVKVGGVWKDALPKVKVSGVWKDVAQKYVKVNGVWKALLATIIYPPNFNGSLTLSYNNDRRLFTESPAANGIELSRDGFHFFTTDSDNVGGDIYQIKGHTLSSKNDVSSITSTQSKNITSDLNLGDSDYPMSCAVNEDGSTIFVLTLSGKLLEYSMSTPYDVTTMVLQSNTTLSIPLTGGGNVQFPSKLKFTNQGNHMIIKDFFGVASCHALTTAYDPTTAQAGSAYDFSVSSTFASELTGYDLMVTNDGTEGVLVGYLRDGNGFISAVCKYLFFYTPYELTSYAEIGSTDVSSQLSLNSINAVDMLVSTDYNELIVLIGEGLSSSSNTNILSFSI